MGYDFLLFVASTLSNAIILLKLAFFLSNKINRSVNMRYCVLDVKNSKDSPTIEISHRLIYQLNVYIGAKNIPS